MATLPSWDSTSLHHHQVGTLAARYWWLKKLKYILQNWNHWYLIIIIYHTYEPVIIFMIFTWSLICLASASHTVYVIRYLINKVFAMQTVDVFILKWHCSIYIYVSYHNIFQSTQEVFIYQSVHFIITWESLLLILQINVSHDNHISWYYHQNLMRTVQLDFPDESDQQPIRSPSNTT